jgi:osmotically-inducible protein OsmY
MFLFRLLLLPVKVGVGSTKLGLKTGFRAGRLLGMRRMVVFGAGVGAGLLLAPVTGAEARARLRSWLEGTRDPGSSDLAERVRFELSHSPRTWHLPQPIVEVEGSTAVLRGQVPHDSGRVDLERTAAAVAGVTRVDNRLVVGTGSGGGDPASDTGDGAPDRSDEAPGPS